MLGLEIRINDEKPLVVGGESLIYVFLTRIASRNKHDMAVGGADDAFHYKWMNADMQDGDKVFIRVVEVDKEDVSSPAKIEKRDRERMKQDFERLKKELQEKRLL